jgi:hypothetical protein
MEVRNDNFPEKLSPCTGRRRGKSYEFLVNHMRDNMIVDDAVVKQTMEFAAASLELKPDAVPHILKILDWSYARAAIKIAARSDHGAMG